MDAPSAELIPGSLLTSFLGAAWAWTLALLLGAALLPRLEGWLGRSDDDEPADARLLAWAVVGIPLQALVWLLLGGLGLLSETSVVATAVGLTLLGAAFAREQLVGALREAADSVAAACRDRFRLATAVAFGMFLAVVSWLALLPTIFYDDLVYHLGLPRQALMIGNWPAYDGYHYSFLPAGWDACYLLPLSLGGGSGPQLMNVVVLTLFALAVRALARDLGATSPVAAGAAALLLVAAPVTLSLGAFAGNDLFVALALTVALRRACVGPAGMAGALTTGLVAGAAWAAKYTSLPAVAAVGLAWLLARPGSLSQRLRQVSLLAGAALLPAAGWTLRTFALTGNPLYPAFFGLLGGRQWSEASAALVAKDISHGGIGDRGVASFLLAARDLAIDSGSLGTPSGLAPAFLLAVLLGLLFGRRVPHRRPLLSAVGLCYLGWCLTSLNLRYALVLLAGLAPFVAALFDRVAIEGPASEDAARRVRSSSAWLFLALVMLSGALATVDGLQRHLALYGDSSNPMLREARAEILPQRLHLAAAGRELDRILPAEARLLLVGEGRMALLPRPVLGASAYDRPVVASWLEAAQGPRELTLALQEAGVTHLVVNHRELARWREQYAWEERLPPGGIELFRRWIADELEPLGTWGAVQVWSLPES